MVSVFTFQVQKYPHYENKNVKIFLIFSRVMGMNWYMHVGYSKGAH